MVAGARPLTEHEAEESPEPPDLGRWHLR
jgi:hypothetical protein